mgnify:CR=1 FL=1
MSLHGFTSNPFAYMARAAVFVLSSTYEGFGNVLVEALCPVAAPSSVRIVRAGLTKYSILVNTGDWPQSVIHSIGRGHRIDDGASSGSTDAARACRGIFRRSRRGTVSRRSCLTKGVMAAPSVSVIIATLGESHLLPKTLEEVRHQADALGAK